MAMEQVLGDDVLTIILFWTACAQLLSGLSMLSRRQSENQSTNHDGIYRQSNWNSWTAIRCGHVTTELRSSAFTSLVHTKRSLGMKNDTKTNPMYSGTTEKCYVYFNSRWIKQVQIYKYLGPSVRYTGRNVVQMYLSYKEKKEIFENYDIRNQIWNFWRSNQTNSYLQ